MIPIKSKKNLEAIIEEIRKFSFSYLKKYAPSRQQLRTYLLKKFFNSPKTYVGKSELLYFHYSILRNDSHQKQKKS